MELEHANIVLTYNPVLHCYLSKRPSYSSGIKTGNKPELWLCTEIKTPGRNNSECLSGQGVNISSSAAAGSSGLNQRHENSPCPLSTNKERRKGERCHSLSLTHSLIKLYSDFFYLKIKYINKFNFNLEGSPDHWKWFDGKTSFFEWTNSWILNSNFLLNGTGNYCSYVMLLFILILNKARSQQEHERHHKTA